MVDQLYEQVKDMDSNDPSAMEKIREYLMILNDEDNLYMQLLLEKIENSEIYWERPWYQWSKSLTRPLLTKQKEDTEEPEGTYKMDSFSSEEAAIVDKNWRKFRKKFKVPDKRLCLARWRNKRNNPSAPEEKVRHFITAYLARGLNRTLYQVYRHIVATYAAPTKGAYTPQEEKIMEICFQNDPYNAVTICAMVLGREPRGLYKKLHISRGMSIKKKRLKWTLPLASKFLKLLMEYTNLPLEELKNRKIEKDVWLKLEADIDQHYVYLQRFWNGKLHVQLFVKECVTLKRLRKRIYKRLSKSTYKIWSDIRWKEVRQQFPDGYTHHFLCSTARQVVARYPKYLQVPLQELLEYGFTMLRNSRNKKFKNLILNENGELILSPIYYYK